jgi:glycosyltransferase involved in cell wall biosynthesis
MDLVAIAWSGLPNYAARAIRAGLDAYGGPVAVLGTRPSVAATGMEAEIGQAIHWLEEGAKVTWSSLSLEVPKVFIVSGWATPSFNRLATEVRARGGKVIVMVDNDWRMTPRHFARAVAFRLFSRAHFSAFWVPGAAGRRFCQMLGAAPSRIVEGLYASDPSVFFPGTDLCLRERRILFVGQFIERKGLRILLSAWREFRGSHSDWSLTAVGSGPLQSELERVGGIEVRPFLPPKDVADLMRTSRFLVLPSLVEHWGLVVNEASLCGCALLCSDTVGAARDLATSTNAFLFKPGSVSECLRALERACAVNDAWLHAATLESTRIAKRFTVAQWGIQFKTLIERVTSGQEASP